jgi:rSAM/selenodomain-associated transferase 1
MDLSQSRIVNKNALIIIAKYPENGEVKTRLEGLTDEKRVEIYTSLLESTMKRLSAISGVDTFIAFAPAEAEEYFSRFSVKLIPLSEGDLGVRMYEAFQHVFENGYERASLVGADIPDLSAEIILNSFDLLSDNNLVYGPAEDGGYYLVGMSSLIKEVFEEVPWSSDATLSQSLKQAERYGYSFGFTETLSDIDTTEDLKKFGLLD